MVLQSQMKQWLTAQDGLENLKLSAAIVPSPGPNEVLVKISTIALNYRDTEVCMGLYNHHKTLSSEAVPLLVPCSDMCGTVVSIGSGSSIWKLGDRVLSIFNQTHLTGQVTPMNMASGLGLPLSGVLCEYRAFPETGLVRAPEGMSDEEACTLPIAGVTAWMALNGMKSLGDWEGLKGETVLIQGTGGVSMAGLVLAKAGGAEGRRLSPLSDADSQSQNPVLCF
jgi:NADPH:quinone reductase-like Zn-dependent oxidoreductase